MHSKGDRTFLELSSFGDMTCGITATDRSLICFGAVPPQLSTNIDSSKQYRSVATGGRHVCALVKDNVHELPGRRGSGSSIQCWGENSRGQSNPPTDSRVAYIRISVGLSHSCAVTSKFALLCWGAREPVEHPKMAGGLNDGGVKSNGVNVNIFL